MPLSLSQLIYLGGRIGDSLGSVSEFQQSGFNALVESKGEWPYDFSTNRIWNYAEPTDDSDQAHMLIDSLVCTDSLVLDVQKFLELLSRWYETAKDVGISTYKLLSEIYNHRQKRKDWFLNIQKWNNNIASNGSLMRLFGLQSIFYKTPNRDIRELYVLSLFQSITTHISFLCGVMCCFHSFLLNSLINKSFSEQQILDLDVSLFVKWYNDFIPFLSTLSPRDATERLLLDWIDNRSRDTPNFFESELNFILYQIYLLFTSKNLHGKSFFSTTKSISLNTKDECLKFKFGDLNPYSIHLEEVQGSVLVSMVIALWSLSHSFKNPEGGFCYSKIFKKNVNSDTDSILHSYNRRVDRWVLSRGFNTVQKIAMIGYDSDTYGAIAGPLLAVAHSSDLDSSDYTTNILKDRPTNAYFQKFL